MGLSKEDLLAHSRYIRDVLAPKIAIEDSQASGRHVFDLTHLRSALEELASSPMTLDILRYSRMEKALQTIAEANGGGWPPDLVVKAKSLIARWEGSIGPLQRVHTDLWAPGGRLEGFAKPHGWFSWEGEFQQVSDTSVHPCRDGIIDNLRYHITADNNVAYAIAMTQGNEANVSKDGSSSYTPLPSDLGAFKLMTTINGEERRKIRVLRSWRLISSLAPAAGIRYDGLYRVTGYGVKLVPGSEGNNDSWRYTFHLMRESCQDSMEKALAVPMPDQLDDWEDYRVGPTYSTDEELIEEVYEGVEEQKRRYTIGENTAGRFGSIDSGYFSPNPSTLRGEVESP
ncbi:MAG: hypothetical protein Q9166_004217 [cf. Caloplaca sp. 2 TL-2023]